MRRVSGWFLAIAGLLSASLPKAALATDAPRSPDPERVSGADKREAAAFGMNAVLRAAATAPDKRSRWWERDDLGNDPARRAMWLESIGDGSGGGLALSGIGEGAGGAATGVPRAGVPVATVGHGEGIADVDGFSRGHGHLVAPHFTREPRGIAAADGRVPAGVVERIVRQNFGRFRVCYQNGLRRNPSLEGRVAVAFTIDTGGSVSVASDRRSDLPDPDVVSCVVRGFANLAFPASPGGLVTVVYPLVFHPDASLEGRE